VKGEKLTSGFSAVLEGEKFTLENMVFSGLGEPSPIGKGEGNMMLTLNESLDFASQLKARDLSIGTLSRIAKPELASLITGTILTFENEVLGELRAIPASLRAHGDVTIVNGSLKGFNLPGLVLKKVEGIPLVPGSLFSRVPPNYQSVFAQPDTNHSRSPTVSQDWM
jgi:hypothetical protein